MSKVFLDTNVLAYAADGTFPKKRARAMELLRTVVTDGTQAVIPTQIMQEFNVVATRKLGIDPLVAKGLLHGFAHFETVQVQPMHINEAIDCCVLNQLSFWDALIVVCAEALTASCC